MGAMFRAYTAPLSTLSPAGPSTSCRHHSPTVTLKTLWPTLPAASVAEQCTSVSPTRKPEPDGGVHVTPDTASVALTPAQVMFVNSAVASLVMFAGTVMTGGVVSAGAATAAQQRLTHSVSPCAAGRLHLCFAVAHQVA
jgi:hypothetical protein